MIFRRYFPLNRITEFISGAFLPAVLFFTGIYFFLCLSKYIFSPSRVAKALRSNKGTSPLAFSSLWLALGGTLGVGNITGVCAAIAVGGAGTVFWIWVCAILSSVIKYTETALAVQYRRCDGSKYFGGPFYYIKDALHSQKTASLFAIVCLIASFTIGNITQAQAASDAVYFAFKIPKPILSFIFAAIIFIICSGGGRLITAFTNFSVPFLCVFYIILSVSVIFVFRENIPAVTQSIFCEAFTPRAELSGIAAYICSPALRLGITRGIMSNEAGCGTAPIAYAAGNSDDACGTGLLGIAEVLCDTLLLCTLTAYTVLLSEASLSAPSVSIAYSAFSSALGNGVKYLLGASIFLFALSAVSAWGFYGRASLEFLGAKPSLFAAYCVMFSASSFFSSFLNEGLCWTLSDISISLMAIINIIALFLLFPKVKSLTAGYFKK